MKQDKYIWDEFRKEEDYALSYIYHQNIDFLFYYGKSFSKDEDFIHDVIQDLFFDLIRTRKKLGETDNIRLYLVKSFRRKLYRALEKEKRQDELKDKSGTEPKIIFSVEEDFILDEDRSRKNKLIRKGMKELNEKQREVLYYKFTCGFDYGQICEIMSISYDSARKLVSRAISSLRKYLSESELFYLLIFRKLSI